MCLTAHSLALLPPDHERRNAEASREEEDPSNPELCLVVGDLHTKVMVLHRGKPR